MLFINYFWFFKFMLVFAFFVFFYFLFNLRLFACRNEFYFREFSLINLDL